MCNLFGKARFYSKVVPFEEGKDIAKQIAAQMGVLYIWMPLPGDNVEIFVREDMKNVLNEIHDYVMTGHLKLTGG